ncbi:MAG TPA: glycosyltransferase family 2 protein [Acidimicrobiales bacterium]|nr:glycosyltransferase family 2 protein [Acidimicrobiales bacterium]
MHYFFDVTAIFTITYFALLNGIYVLFTLIAWRSLSMNLKRRNLQGFEEPFDTPFIPGITVIVPAYNEETGIVDSVRSLVDLRYPKFEIVVVSDGSTDATVERLKDEYDLVPAHRAARKILKTKPIISSFVSRHHPNIWVIEKENGGKADALNVGIDVARYPYFCAIDADALIEPDALLQVAAPILSDPDRVVASGGIVRIVNGCTVDHGRVVEVDLPKSRIAVFQVIEYFRAFLVGRVGWTRFNSLLIISGAFGLFRRDLVTKLGGYATDTVGEDLELVVRIHRYHRERKLDYRVVFVPGPVCWTEAPEDLLTLSRQRRRWHRGLGQTLWKHRAALLRPSLGALGLFALPYFLFFEFLGPVVEVAGPPITIVAFVLGYLSVPFLVAFIVIAFLLGVTLTVAALTIEEFNFRRHRHPRDIVRLLAYSITENIGYRQLTDLWRTMAFVDLVKGKTEWGAQRRRGFQSRSS